jgi:8-oxo-dGTP pyrophosphatase MutT (NUDIX family)
MTIAAAFMLLRSPTGTVLLLRRAKTEDHPGSWDLPGGKIKNGETLRESSNTGSQRRNRIFNWP